LAEDGADEEARLTMLAKLDGGDAADHPYIPVGNPVRTFRVNNDGTFTAVVNITAQSALYGVQFTFTLLATTYDTDGGPPLTAERAAWVDEICGHPHVVDFWSEVDQGPSQVLYNYGVIVVGPEGANDGDQVRVRMDHLNDPATFGAIDAAWARMAALGVT
jgi:hypothetical protein